MIEENINEALEDIMPSDENHQNELTEYDFYSMRIEEIMQLMESISNSEQPLSVAKKVEELRSVFYQKLNELKQANPQEIHEEKNNEPTLHPYEKVFRVAYQQFKRNKAKERTQREESEKVNLLQKQAIIAEIGLLIQGEEKIGDTFEKFRTLQEKWRNTGNVPITESNNLWQSYHFQVERFYDYLRINQDLRDLDFQKNLEEKTTICKKAEELAAEKSLNKAHQTLQELHEHWKNIGPVKPELRDGIWERFQVATKIIHKKRNDYFEEKKNENLQKLEQKNNICKAINDLADTAANSHKEWQELISKCEKLEQDWHAIGRLEKIENTGAWKLFKAAINYFQTKKNDFYKQRKATTDEVIAKKMALCQQAEELQNDTNWKETTSKVIQLQKEWKETGSVPQKISENIWKRFHSACNHFFHAKEEFFSQLDKEKMQNLEHKKILLEEIKAYVPSTDGKSTLNALREFSNRWKACGPVPLNEKKIEQDFSALLNQFYDNLKLEQTELDNEKFRNKIISMHGNNAQIQNERELLKAELTNKQGQISQYETNLGFFTNNKNNDSIKSEIMKKIVLVKKEVEKLQEKLRIMDRI